MKGADRNLLLIVPLIALLGAFWLLVLSPKQDQVKKLDTQVSELQTAVGGERQKVQQGLRARKQFPRDYQRLVVTGKAAPTQDETASLLVQVNRSAEHSGVSFETIAQGTDSSSGVAAPTATATSGVPAGAGPGGLTALPYTLTFNGTFFQIADFIARLDRLVDPKQNTIAANGRLTTIDSIQLGSDGTKPLPALLASVSVTTYLTPSAATGALSSGAPPTAAPASSTTAGTTSAATSTPASTTTAAPTSP